MKTFKIEKPNKFYYITSVTFNRIPVFRHADHCQQVIDILSEARQLFPYKLIAYVIMPDHFHVIINPINGDPSKWLLRVRGNSARKILSRIKAGQSEIHPNWLRLATPQKRGHIYALWQKDPLIIHLESDKFLLQKSGYIHANPVRAALVDHPAKWPWSSYAAYLKHARGDVPIAVDHRAYWTDEELMAYSSAGGVD